MTCQNVLPLHLPFLIHLSQQYDVSIPPYISHLPPYNTSLSMLFTSIHHHYLQPSSTAPLTSTSYNAVPRGQPPSLTSISYNTDLTCLSYPPTVAYMTYMATVRGMGSNITSSICNGMRENRRENPPPRHIHLVIPRNMHVGLEAPDLIYLLMLRIYK